MTAVSAVTPAFQFSDSAGTPLAFGTVDVYLAGSTTRSTTWQDAAQATANTNPIVLDSTGSCTIRLDPSVSYKWVVTSAAGVIQSHLSRDNIIGNGADQGISNSGAASLLAMQTLFNRIYLGAF